MEKNKIYLGDNLKLIKEMEDNSVDLVLTDPYYETMGIGNSKATKQDIKSNFIELCPELFRVLKMDSNLIFFCSLEWMFKNFIKIVDCGFNFKYEIVWNKNRGISFLTAKKRPLQKHETIFVFSKGKHKYNFIEGKTEGHKPTKRGVYNVEKDYVSIKTTEHKNNGERYMTSVLDYNTSSYNKQTTHPFEKPLDLSSHLIKAFSYEGELIMDPYSGSGNICVSSKINNRNFIGFELQTEYFNESMKNIKKHLVEQN
tara:strand:- start:534 stop:1301 length:768 start_codon:yes stop_codon:yes gene_type:complete